MVDLLLFDDYDDELNQMEKEKKMLNYERFDQTQHELLLEERRVKESMLLLLMKVVFFGDVVEKKTFFFLQ